MGFFSDLVDLAPHRTVAHEIKEYCSNTELSSEERRFLDDHELNPRQYIWLKNSYNYCVFQAVFVAMNNQYPNSHFSIAKSFLDGIITDVFYTDYAVDMLEELFVPLPSSYGLWTDYFDEFCEEIARKNNKKISAEEKYQLDLFTKGYQLEVIEFMKLRTNKLKKPL